MKKTKHEKTDRDCILLFVKAPEAGRVKTRLLKEFDPPTVVDLYVCFVADILSTLRRTGYPFFLCHDPPEASEVIGDWLGDSLPRMPQHPGDLGERMAEAFENCFSGGIERAVLIGTDIPDLPPAFIHEAFSRLGDHPVVLGPADDGGYYLIGFRYDSFTPAIFQEMPWSTPSVLPRTRTALKALGLSCHLLPVWKDIDTPEDLKALARHPAARQNAPNTLAYLTKMGLNDRSSLQFENAKEERKGSKFMSDEKANAKADSGQSEQDKNVQLYGLSTCSHCKATKQLLDECTIKYNVIDVDLLDGDERKAIIEDVKKFNPRCSFPTIIIGETVIVGYKENEIKEALGL